MDKNKLNSIFGDDEHISQDMIIQYYEGKLSPKDMHRVEKYLSEDEFTEEAMEGLSMMNNKAKLSPTIIEINKKINEKTKAKKSKLIVLHPSVKYAIAATILLIICISFFFNVFLKGLEQNEVAENKSNEQKTEEPAITESVNENATVSEASKDVTSEETKEQQKGFAINPKGERAANKVVMPDNRVLEDAEMVPSESEEGAVMESAADESKKSIDANLSMGKAKVEPLKKAADKDAKGEAIADDVKLEEFNANSKNDSPKKSAESRKKEKYRANAESKSAQAPSSVQSGAGANNEQEIANRREDETAAGAKTKLAMSLEVLKKDPANDEALFYAGLSSNTLKEYKRAIEYFDKIIPKKQSTYYEDAIYHKALALINQKKVKEAEKLLQQLVDFKGRKAADASTKLKELK